MSTELQLHPLCTLFPRITGTEFDALVVDIKANGLREPIIIHDNMILDGGNRYRACIEAGVEPAVMKFGGGNLVSYVLSANLHRRHLSAIQAAAIVASAQDWANAQTGGGTGANQHKQQPGKFTGLQTVASRRAQSGASDKTQRMADKIAKADPDLAKALGRGEVSPSDAVEKVTGKRPGAKPRTQKKPKLPFGKSDEEVALDNDLGLQLEMAQGAIDALNEENERLRNQVAAMVFDGSEEDRAEYRSRLDSLISDNRRLAMLNQALTDARDSAMAEANALRGQIKYLQRQAKK